MTTYNVSLNNWQLEEKPREKLLLYGPRNLSDTELIAIVLGSGSLKQNVIDLARTILASVENDLSKLEGQTVKELKKIHGVGDVKAVTLLAVMEIAKRSGLKVAEKKQFIKSSKDAFNVLSISLTGLAHEEFWVIVLSRSNQVLTKKQLSSGGSAGTVVDTKLLFQYVLEVEKAQSIIIAHNHPSNNLVPSEADKRLTEKIKEGGLLLDIKLLDHLIIGQDSYYSFLDEGMVL